MNHGITIEAILPVRQTRSERGALVNQALFGELYEVVEEEERWVRVRLCHDRSTGWIARASHHAVDEAYAGAYLAGERVVTPSLFTPLAKEGEWGARLVVAGSLLPLFDRSTGRSRAGGAVYIPAGSAPVGAIETREQLSRGAFMYYNTPYLPGGRSPRGIDDTGLVQVIYRLAGRSLPRDLEGQLATGETLSFLEEALPGDLLFFGDEEKVSHVGIAWEGGRLVHASGRVRVDRVDHHGIFNEELRRYTHALKVIKRAW
ncbi:MAG: C40 family peptidase [Odoribacteraceae bacterium]|jgi:hypothetical protein|nr:C40 family peptidase [Odoribacteraceae bacterium]